MTEDERRAAFTNTARAGWRNLTAVFLGKTLISATRLLKQGGTTLPGRAALKISPELLSFFSKQLAAKTTAVTGTNGKTSTASLLAAIYKLDGRRCLHNKAGSNLTWGIASTLLEAGTWKAKLTEKCAVFEVDEGAFPAVSRNLQPGAVVVTNIFRDQLDRFGSVEQVLRIIQKGVQALPPGAAVFLNADDPLVASIKGEEKKTLFYGLDAPPSTNTAGPAIIKQPAVPCPRCRRDLLYSRIYFAHLGHYRCPFCGFCRPEPDYKLRRFEIIPDKGTAMILSLRGSPLRVTLPLPGIYNLYNALAAAAAAAGTGLSNTAIKKALNKAASPSGRMERRQIASRELLIALIKNAAGANQVLSTLFQEEQGQRISLLIAINSYPADGADLSWLQEINFKQLAAAHARITGIILSGTGAGITARQLEKAGLDPAKMIVEPALSKALRRAIAAAAPDEKLVVLPNYTAMRQLQRKLDRIK